MKLSTVAGNGVAETEMVFRQKFGEVVMEDKNNAEDASIKINGQRADRTWFEGLTDIP